MGIDVLKIFNYYISSFLVPSIIRLVPWWGHKCCCTARAVRTHTGACPNRPPGRILRLTLAWPKWSGDDGSCTWWTGMAHLYYQNKKIHFAIFQPFAQQVEIFKLHWLLFKYNFINCILLFIHSLISNNEGRSGATIGELSKKRMNAKCAMERVNTRKQCRILKHWFCNTV